LINLQWGKTKSRIKIKPQENQPSWSKTKSASFYPKKADHQSSQVQNNLLKFSKMHLSMKDQRWKKNIVVVERRRGENVRWWCEKWWRLEGYS